MSPMSTLTSLTPTATPGGNQDPAGASPQRGLPFWPVLFGGLSFRSLPHTHPVLMLVSSSHLDCPCRWSLEVEVEAEDLRRPNF